MSTSSRQPTAERRRQIAEAALRILSTQGVRRLTAAALAAEVGIADGTIFRHFKNKEEIVDAAIDLFVETLEASFPSDEGEPLERLGSFFVKRLTLIRKNPELLRLAFNDRLVEAAGAEGAARVEQLVERSVSFIRACLAEAQQRGDVAQGPPSMLLVWTVIGVLRGASIRNAPRVKGEKALSSVTPKQVWLTLEQFLRNTTQASLA